MFFGRWVVGAEFLLVVWSSGFGLYGLSIYLVELGEPCGKRSVDGDAVSCSEAGVRRAPFLCPDTEPCLHAGAIEPAFSG